MFDPKSPIQIGNGISTNDNNDRIFSAAIVRKDLQRSADEPLRFDPNDQRESTRACSASMLMRNIALILRNAKQ